MSVDSKTVDRIAHLARLEFSEEEKEELLNDLNSILKLVDKLGEVDTEGVDPLIYMLNEKARLREDEVRHEIDQDDALRNSPDKDSDYIRVPKVLERD